MDDHLFSSWKRHVVNLEAVLQDLSGRRIISVGMSSYPRVIPALFMTRRSFGIYAVHDSRDIDILRERAVVYCMGERNPKIAEKVQSLAWLLKNYNFQAFLKSRKEPETLLFYRTSPALINVLDEQKVPWLGYNPAACEKLSDPSSFRSFLSKFKLSHLPERIMSKDEFMSSSFETLFRAFKKSFIVEPESFTAKVTRATINDAAQLEELKAAANREGAWDSVKKVRVLPLITGEPCSIIGCVTDQGVLTSGLHFPLIDLPESLQGSSPQGKIFGYDLAYAGFSEDTRIEAQVAAELVGEELSKKGYVGPFGLEFVYDTAKKVLFTLSFAPGFPPDALEFSLQTLLSGAPPPELFALTGYLKLPLKFHFEAVNDAWKARHPVSSISFTSAGMDHMTMDLQPGAYRYDAKEKFAERVESVLFLHELPSEKYFLIFDSVPRPGQKILPNSTRMFKFFFPTSIIGGSNKIKPLYAEILNNFSHALRGTSPIQTSNQDAPLSKDLKGPESGPLEEDEADLE